MGTDFVLDDVMGGPRWSHFSDAELTIIWNGLEEISSEPNDLADLLWKEIEAEFGWRDPDPA